ncbi:MAG: Ig-like domain repeat protein, partial [Methanosphaera sp.]
MDGSRFALEIDKPVNIISSSGDAYLNLYPGIFKVSKEGAGTNISDITFYTTHVRIENTSNVKINNISCIDDGASIGQGVGSFSVREGSENITITNSYFMTRGNGGHSNVVFAAAYNCLFENNTVEGYGDHYLIGNLLYLTTYNVKYATPVTNINITIRNNIIRSYNADSYATCFGLVLEGSGHIIEGNIIDNAFPVMAQYADADYDFETNINGIIFNNNTILRSIPQLVFPGIVSNNTFYGGAELKQVYAYNNIFNTVTIGSSVKFENNTANSVTVTGDNNELNNNEVYSNEEYAITVKGDNNTLSNNKFASVNGRGEKAINNSTEIISLNNSENISRVTILDDDSYDKYVQVHPNFSSRSNFIEGMLQNNDYIIINTDKINGKYLYLDDVPADYTTYLKILNDGLLNSFLVQNSKVILFDSMIPTTSVVSYNDIATLVNSTILHTKLHVSNNSVILEDYPSDNTRVLTSYTNVGKLTEYIAQKNGNGILGADIVEGSTILVHIYDDGGSATRYYSEGLFLDRPLNLEAIPGYGIIGSPVRFNDGTKNSVVNNITFNNYVIINDSHITFTNCTFNSGVEVNQEYITFQGNTFNGKINLTNVNGLILKDNILNLDDSLVINSSRLVTIENNDIITTADNTIVFDDESNSNTVKNNILTANTLLGDDSVVGGDNIVEDNGAAYNTSIEIVADESLFKNDVSNVTVTVYNLLNNTPVDRGYVEVYLDGIVQGIKPLVNGQITLEVNTNKSSFGSVPLKVWYYDGIRYANNVSSISVNVVKSNVSISLDEFTAKLNEKATVTATFLNQNGNPVGDTNVTFTVGRSTYTILTENGVATINELVTSEWLDAGKLIVSFPSTDAYNSNSTTITLNTSKADIHITPTVSVEGSTANINLALTDELNSNVTDGKVTITTLDGTQLASGRVSNGVYTATVTIPDDYTSEYLVANFTGSYYYNDLVRNIKLSGMLNSTITIETNSPVYGEELIITGKLVDSRNNAIKDTNITVNINGVKEVISTDADGNYTYSILPELGVNTITVSFDGNSDVYATSATKDITIRDTDHDMNEVLNQLDELTAENARLQEQLDNLTQLSNDLKEQLANQTGELSEQNAALQQQIDTLTTIIAALTDIINSQNEQIAALTAPENTTIIFNDVVDVRYKSDVVISGILTSQKGMALSGQTVTLTIGDKSVDVITKNGEFEYTTVFKSVGEQTITASYAGNDNYLNSEAALTFDVAKQDVVVTVDPIADSAYGDNVTITGKFSDVDGKAISNSNVRVFVNGKKFLAKTDNTGTYTLSVKVNAVGENNVTVAYAGNDNYNSYEDTTTFKADKQDVVVTGTVINIPKVGENVTITGTFTDKNGKAIINSNVKITINGKKYYARTDST